MSRADTITDLDLEAIRRHLSAVRREIAAWAITHPARRRVDDNLGSISRLVGPPLPRIPFGTRPPPGPDRSVLSVYHGPSLL